MQDRMPATKQELGSFVSKLVAGQIAQVPTQTSFDSVDVDVLTVDDTISLTPQALEYVGTNLRTPAARVFCTTTPAVGAAAWTVMTWDNKSHDTTLKMWSASATDRITITADGTYDFKAYVGWNAAATTAGIRFTINGAATPFTNMSINTGLNGTGPVICDAIRCATGDVIKVEVYHVVGATPISNQNFFTATRIG